MKAKQVTYKCFKRLEGCIGEWQEYTVDDPPYYKECKNCFERSCQDENELLSDCDN
jgi:hypothetical protein